MITVLLIGFAAAVGALSGGWSAALLDQSRRTPVTDATLGVIGFVLVFYTQLHWMRAPFALIPLSLKSLFGTLLLPVVHQVARSRSSQ